MANDVKVLKLISGEELITRVTTGDNGLTTMDKPMILQTTGNPRTGRLEIGLMPWFSTSKNFEKTQKISILTEFIIIEDDPIDDLKRDYLTAVTGLTL